MKLAVITDTHFGSHGSSPAILETQSRFFKDVFFPHLTIEGVTDVLHLGDFFDNRRETNSMTLQAVNECYISESKKRGIRTTIIPGNHDCYYKSTNSVNSLDLLLLPHGKEVFDVITSPITTKWGIDLIPWISPENEAECLKFIRDSRSRVCAGHFAINGFDVGAHLEEHGLQESIFSKYSEVWSGHFHKKQESRRIQYLGSPYPLSFGEAPFPHGYYIATVPVPKNYVGGGGDEKILKFFENPVSSFVFVHPIASWFSEGREDHLSVDRYKNSYVKVIVADPKIDEYKLSLWLSEVNKVAYKVIVVDATQQFDPLSPLDNPLMEHDGKEHGSVDTSMGSQNPLHRDHHLAGIIKKYVSETSTGDAGVDNGVLGYLMDLHSRAISDGQ